ncbi:BLUF domain-containing protein [uncultured Vibrio sp.]|uniref:BLUF domain-containing protein n=1 Tax=uncultured Vibrio sp. TaxID=114054 RepID=UPI00262C477C|nr:BLUF domain-containing protein [uncultured Vibrio sp.]
MAKLKHIIYKSSAILKNVDLDEILNVARSHNSAVDISGVLVTHTHGFIQYIEGPPNNIDDLYERIKRDPRHHDVTTLSTGEVFERRYQDWSMGYLCLADKPMAESLSNSDFSSHRFYEVIDKSLPLG